jgi:hypothetical protein
LSIDLEVVGATAELSSRTLAAGVAKAKVLECKTGLDGSGTVAGSSTGNGEIRGVCTSQSATINGGGRCNSNRSVSAKAVVINEDIRSGASYTAILKELASGTLNGEGMCGLRAIWVEGSSDFLTARQRGGTTNQGSGHFSAGVASDGGSVRVNLSITGNDGDEASLQFGVDVHGLVVTGAAADSTVEIAATHRVVVASGEASILSSLVHTVVPRGESLTALAVDTGGGQERRIG